MHRRFQILIAIAALLVVISVFLNTDFDPPPCRELPLSHLVSSYIPTFDSGRKHEWAEAIAEIGTNAIPHLLECIEYPPHWTTPVYRFASETLEPLGISWEPPMDKNFARAVGAIEAFRVLGTNAEAAIPHLSKFLVGSKSNEFPLPHLH